jgi:uncharacterized protein (TIGR02186 family)
MMDWVVGLALLSSASVGAVPGPAPKNPGGDPAQVDTVAVTELRVEPEEVRAGMFFDGATIAVSALVPDDIAVAVVCIGADESVVLNRKGKVLGLIWMNVGEVEFDDVPSLYLVNSSTHLAELAAPPQLAALRIGYDALEARAGAANSVDNRSHLFHELVRLKESEGLYSIAEGSVHLSAVSQGRARIATEFRLPAKTPTGDYRILVYGFSRAEGALVATERVRLTKVGAASFISGLAIEHGLLYGALAVAVAVSVGLLAGMVFDLGSKKGH